MLKSLEKILSLLSFLAMFVFISQLEADILPFWAALSGIISCGGLAVILLMHGADLHFYLELNEEKQADEVESVLVYPSNVKTYPSCFKPSKAA